MKINLNTISYTTAISLAAFSGGVATFGMMKLVPGAEIVVGAMGLLFEAGKLTSFAMLHRRSVPRLLRGALATVGLTLMAANIAGVSGFLSHEYEKTHINAQATATPPSPPPTPRRPSSSGSSPRPSKPWPRPGPPSYARRTTVGALRRLRPC